MKRSLKCHCLILPLFLSLFIFWFLEYWLRFFSLTIIVTFGCSFGKYTFLSFAFCLTDGEFLKDRSPEFCCDFIFQLLPLVPSTVLQCFYAFSEFLRTFLHRSVLIFMIPFAEKKNQKRVSSFLASIVQSSTTQRTCSLFLQWFLKLSVSG